MNDEIKIVIGSWGSYNACNERALGSKWLTLSDYDDWEEIEKELKKEGFILNGIDKELFIQDIEGINADNNWDYEIPKNLFKILTESEVLIDSYKYETMQAYLEIYTFDDWKNLVNKYGSSWDSDIVLYKNMDWYDLGYELLHDCYEIPEYLENYIDYEKFGEELSYDGYAEYSDGIIAVR